MTREEARDQIVIFMADEHKVINDRDRQALDMAIKELEQEPKTGHWIVRDDLCSVRYYQCSECNEIGFYDTDFCPNCGAKMDQLQEKRCADCNHYGKLSLDCGRCDDDCSMFEL